MAPCAVRPDHRDLRDRFGSRKEIHSPRHDRDADMLVCLHKAAPCEKAEDPSAGGR